MRKTMTAVLLALLAAGCGSGGASGLGGSGGAHAVRYTVLGTAAGADLTWSDGNGGTEQAQGKAVPMVDEAGQPSWISFEAASGAPLYISAQNTGDFGDVTCVIEVDGAEVKRATSSGAYAVVSCSTLTP